MNKVLESHKKSKCDYRLLLEAWMSCDFCVNTEAREKNVSSKAWTFEVSLPYIDSFML